MFRLNRRIRPFDSLISRLMLLGLCLVTIGIAARYYAISHFLREDLATVVEAQQLALATYVARDIDERIVHRRNLLERIGAALPPDLLRRPAALRAWLKERYEFQPLFSAGLFVTDTRGVALADYPVLPDREHGDYADRDYIKDALAGRTTIGRPVMGRAAKEPVLPMAVPLLDGRGEVRGALVGITALATPGFLDLLQQSHIGKGTGGFLLVSPQDRLFVAASEPDMVFTPTPPSGVNALHDRAMAGYRGTGITVNAKGVEEVSAMVTVPSTGWFLVARLPSREAFATVARTQSFLLRNGVLAFMVFAALASTGMYVLLRPLSRAADHAERMTRGEIPLEPLPVVRQDEVGHLIGAFNRLLMKLDEQQAELARIAHHDSLTGLPNRALLADRLHQALARAQRTGSRVALLFMDLDGFKLINDSLGHEAGDDALRQVAQRLGKIVRQSDTLARVGGDEFVLLLCDLGEDAEAAAGIVAQKCIETLLPPLTVADIPCAIGVSIGIATGSGDTAAGALLQAADRGMYRAKKAGRGRYVACPV